MSGLDASLASHFTSSPSAFGMIRGRGGCNYFVAAMLRPPESSFASAHVHPPGCAVPVSAVPRSRRYRLGILRCADALRNTNARSTVSLRWMLTSNRECIPSTAGKPRLCANSHSAQKLARDYKEHNVEHIHYTCAPHVHHTGPLSTFGTSCYRMALVTSSERHARSTRVLHTPPRTPQSTDCRCYYHTDTRSRSRCIDALLWLFYGHDDRGIYQPTEAREPIL